eukprot:jgi/Bigna1/69251/fgenesh1_pg.8_\
MSQRKSSRTLLTWTLEEAIYSKQGGGYTERPMKVSIQKLYQKITTNQSEGKIEVKRDREELGNVDEQLQNSVQIKEFDDATDRIFGEQAIREPLKPSKISNELCRELDPKKCAPVAEVSEETKVETLKEEVEAGDTADMTKSAEETSTTSTELHIPTVKKVNIPPQDWATMIVAPRTSQSKYSCYDLYVNVYSPNWFMNCHSPDQIPTEDDEMNKFIQSQKELETARKTRYLTDGYTKSVLPVVAHVLNQTVIRRKKIENILNTLERDKVREDDNRKKFEEEQKQEQINDDEILAQNMDILMKLSTKPVVCDRIRELLVMYKELRRKTEPRIMLSSCEGLPTAMRSTMAATISTPPCHPIQLCEESTPLCPAFCVQNVRETWSKIAVEGPRFKVSKSSDMSTTGSSMDLNPLRVAHLPALVTGLSPKCTTCCIVGT